jgi:hypothetical protein
MIERAEGNKVDITVKLQILLGDWVDSAIQSNFHRLEQFLIHFTTVFF